MPAKKQQNWYYSLLFSVIKWVYENVVTCSSDYDFLILTFRSTWLQMARLWGFGYHNGRNCLWIPPALQGNISLATLTLYSERTMLCYLCPSDHVGSKLVKHLCSYWHCHWCISVMLTRNMKMQSQKEASKQN